MKGSTKFWLSVFILIISWCAYKYMNNFVFIFIIGIYLFISLVVFGMDKLAKLTPLGTKWNIFWGLNWIIKRFNIFLDKHLDI